MTPPPPAFYVTGGAMPRDASSYVPRDADKQFYTGLRQGEFSYVLTARQMGKSSLMVRTAQQLRADGVTVVTLDLTAIGQNLTAEQWYDGLLTVMGRQLQLAVELDDYWQHHERLGPLQRFMGAIREVILARRPGPIVIFVDEIDYIRSLPFPTGEFFAAVRECYNTRAENPEYQRLTFAMLGVAAPSDLIRDTRTTPFNIGRRVELHDFTPAEAAVLAKGLNRDARVAERLLRRVLRWTGGNPYLTQRLCQGVAERQGVIRPAGVDQMCRSLFLSPGARDRDDNLLFVRDRLLRAAGETEEDQVALLDLYEQVRRGHRVPDHETNPLVGLLRLSGAVRTAEGHLRVRNRIYARVFDKAWVTAHLPGAEKRRQRRAFRRGALRASSIAVLAMAAFAALGWIAWTKSRDAITATAKLDAFKDEQEKISKAQKEAEDARKDADSQRELALRKVTIDLSAFNGIGLQDKGDQAGALLWFWNTLDLARGDATREASHRLRLAAALEQCPRPVRVWNAGGPIKSAEFSPDGQRVLAIREDEPELKTAPLAKTVHEALIWDLRNDRLISRIPLSAKNLEPRFAPDGRWLFDAELGHSNVRGVAWDAETGQPRRGPWEGGMESYSRFSPDGRWAATLEKRKIVRLWAAATGTPIGEPFEMPEAVVAINFDGGRLLLTTEGGRNRVLDAATAQPIGREWTSRANAFFLDRFSQDGRLVVVTNWSSSTEIWEVAEGRLVKQIVTTDLIGRTFFARGDQWLVTLESGPGRDDLVRAYEIASGQVKQTIPVGGRQASHTLSKNGRWLAVWGDEKKLRIIDLSPPIGEPERARPDLPGENPDRPLGDTLPVLELDRQPAPIRSTAFSPDGRYVATAYADGTARVWDFRRKEAVTPPLIHAGPVTHTSFSPDGRLLLTASKDGTVRVWDLAVGHRPICARDGARTKAAACSDNGRQVLLVHDDGTACVCEVGTDKCQQFPAVAGEWVVRGWLSPDGSRAALARATGPPLVWEVGTANRVELKDTAGELLSCSFDPESHWLLAMTTGAGEKDREVRLWDATRGVCVRTVPGGASSAAIGPAGALAVARRDGVILLWSKPDVAEPRELKIPESKTAESRRVSAAFDVLAFSGDGHRLVTGGSDRTARVWSVSSGELLTDFKHSEGVVSVCLSRDGQFALAASDDGTAQLWDVDRKAPAGLFQSGGRGGVASFDPTEQYVVMCTRGTVRVWDRTTGKPVTPALDTEFWGTSARLSMDPHRLVVIGDGRVQVWDFTRAAAPLEELLRVTQGRSASKFASKDDWRVIPAEAADLTRPGSPDGSMPEPDDDRRHSWREVFRCEAASDWDAALWHLDRLVGDRPSSALLVYRGNVYVRLGRFEEASKDYDQAADTKPSDVTLPWAVARLHLARGDAAHRAWSQARPRAALALGAEDAARPDGPMPPWFRECEQSLAKLPLGHPLTAELMADLLLAYSRVAAQLTGTVNVTWTLEALRRCRELAGSLKRGGLGSIAIGLRSEAKRWYFSAKEVEKKDTGTAFQMYLAALAFWDLTVGEVPESNSERSEVYLLLTRLGATTPAADRKARLDYYLRALAIATAWVQPRQPLENGVSADREDLDIARQNLGAVLDLLADLALEDGNLDLAEGYYRRAFDSDRQWLGSDPSNRKARAMAAYSYTSLAKLAMRRPDLAAARGYYEGAAKLRESVVAELSATDDDRTRLAETYRALGDLCRDTGDVAGAKYYYLQQLNLFQKVEDSSPLTGRRLDLTLTYEGLGRSFYNLGEYADAARSWQKALDRRETDLKRDPLDREARAGVAEALEWLGDIELVLGNPGAAYDYCRRCRDLKQQILDEKPTDRRAKLVLGYAHIWFARASFAAGELKQAREASEALLALVTDLETGSRDDPQIDAFLASGRYELGHFWLQLGDAEKAATQFRKLLELRRESARAASLEDSESARDLFSAHIALGRVELERNNVPAAIGWFEGAVKLAREKAERSRDLVPPQLNLATGYRYLGRAELQAGRFAEAVKWYEQAQTIYRRLAADGKLGSAANSKAARNLDWDLAAARGAARAIEDIEFARKQPTREAAVDLLILRAVALARNGDHKGAFAAAEAIRGLGPQDAENLFDVARCYGQILRAVSRGRPADGLLPEEKQVRADCASRAVEALTTAVGRGFKDGVRLVNDGGIAAIRSEAGYQKLILQFGSGPDPK